MLDAWGWRIAFLIGASIVPFGLALRRTLEETLPAEAKAPPPPGSLRPLLIVAVAGMLILGAGTISNYTLDYLTTYAQDSLHMAVRSAFGATLVLGLVSTCATSRPAGWSMLWTEARADPTLAGPDSARCADFLCARCARSTTALFGATALLTLLHIFGSSAAILLFIQALPARSRGLPQPRLCACHRDLRRQHAAGRKAADPLDRKPVAPGWYMALAVAAGLAGAMMIRQPERPSRP